MLYISTPFTILPFPVSVWAPGLKLVFLKSGCNETSAFRVLCRDRYDMCEVERVLLSSVWVRLVSFPHGFKEPIAPLFLLTHVLVTQLLLSSVRFLAYVLQTNKQYVAEQATQYTGNNNGLTLL